MRARRTLSRPIAAATLLATLVAPQVASAAATPAPLPMPVAPKLAKPMAVAVTPVVKHVRFTRHAASRRYRVKEGDCLWLIARAYLGRGRAWRAIYAANRDVIRHPDLIYPGQMLSIPRRPDSLQGRHERRTRHQVRARNTRHVHAHHLRVSELNRPSARHDGPFSGTQQAHRAPVVRPVAAVQAPSPEAAGLTSETFQGHTRIDGHFYVLRQGKLVWADDGTSVHGSWSKRISEQVYPNREAFDLQQAQTAPKEVLEAPQAVQSVDAPDEPTIQGHRRVNGTFFVRRLNMLLWADTGEPVRSTPGALVAP